MISFTVPKRPALPQSDGIETIVINDSTSSLGDGTVTEGILLNINSFNVKTRQFTAM